MRRERKRISGERGEGQARNDNEAPAGPSASSGTS